MGSAPSDFGEQASTVKAAPAGRVIRLPAIARPAILLFNFLAQIIPLWIMHETGQGWPIFLVGAVLLGVIPAIDYALGQGGYTFDDGLSEHAKKGLLWMQAVFLLLAFAASIAVAASGRVPLWAAIFAVFTIGMVNVHVSVVAHEFGHRMDRTNRMISNAVCAIGGLGYFMPQHVMGHHVDVATPEDSASARFGQTSYGFIFKSFFPEVMGGIRLEAARLRKRGLPVWSFHNDVIMSYLFTVLLAGILVALLGWIALPFILLHHAAVWFSLMLNDYIQHYGVLREMLPNGRREPQSPAHSWSADSPLCNLLVFNVQRHAHHHERPRLAYDKLEALDHGPQCPTGYFGMMVLALNPPWWRHVMDPLLVKYAEGKRERINMTPGDTRSEKRLQKLLDAYHAG